MALRQPDDGQRIVRAQRLQPEAPQPDTRESSCPDADRGDAFHAAAGPDDAAGAAAEHRAGTGYHARAHAGGSDRISVRAAHEHTGQIGFGTAEGYDSLL